VLAATTAWLLVASILLVGWHRAHVVHGVCAEHGEEIHYERVAGAHAATGSDVASLTDVGWIASDGDSHCEILATAHTPHQASVAPTHHHVVVAAVDPTPPWLTPAPPALALYRLAPKTSPPRV
jgi:hypothetical protein